MKIEVFDYINHIQEQIQLGKVEFVYKMHYFDNRYNPGLFAIQSNIGKPAEVLMTVSSSLGKEYNYRFIRPYLTMSTNRQDHFVFASAYTSRAHISLNKEYEEVLSHFFNNYFNEQTAGLFNSET